jgi:hypothetical protein
VGPRVGLDATVKRTFPFSPGIKAPFHHVPALGLVSRPTATTVVATCRAINSRDMEHF